MQNAAVVSQKDCSSMCRYKSTSYSFVLGICMCIRPRVPSRLFAHYTLTTAASSESPLPGALVAGLAA